MPRECLCPRESEALILAAKGLTTVEIGQEMFVSAQTVKHYLKSIYRKLGLRNRVELVDQGSTGVGALQ